MVSLENETKQIYGQENKTLERWASPPASLHSPSGVLSECTGALQTRDFLHGPRSTDLLPACSPQKPTLEA